MAALDGPEPGGSAVAGTGANPPAGLIDLYRSIWTTFRGSLARGLLPILIEIAVIGAYVALRTVAPERSVLGIWVVAAAILSVAAPTSGLVVLVAIAPFSEPLALSRQLGVKPILIAALALGVLLRVVADRRSLRLSPPVLLGGALAAGTFLGLAGTYLRFGAPFTRTAAQAWLAGVGGAMMVLFVATWVARRGELRPLIVAVASATIGGIISLADFLDAELVRGGAVGWLLRPDRIPLRLSGIISSPNGVTALLVVPVALLIAAAVLARDLRLRVAAALLAVPLLIALYFTYSRAALLGIFVLVVIVGWRVRRSIGVGLLVVGLVAGALLLPQYLEARAEAVGRSGRVQPGEVIVASDYMRLRAWAAAGRMWLERPLTGHGFLSFHQLHKRYGEPVLGAPHNEWLRFFAEEGVVVGVAGVAFAGTTLIYLNRRRDWLAVGILGAFAAWGIAATFNNPTGFVQVNAIVFTVVGTGLALAVRAPPGPAPDGSAQAREAKPGGPLGRGDDDPPGQDGGQGEQ